jgi:hypothetical protein
MGIRLLEVGQVCSTAFNQAVDIHQPATLTRLLHGQTVLRHRQADEVGDAGARGAGAEKEEGVVLHVVAEDAQCGVDAGDGHGRSALNVVVVAADEIAVAGQERYGVEVGEVLELDAAARKQFLHGRHKFFEEIVVFGPPDARLAETEVERIVNQSFVVGADVQRDGQRDLRRHAGARGV